MNVGEKRPTTDFYTDAGGHDIIHDGGEGVWLDLLKIATNEWVGRRLRMRAAFQCSIFSNNQDFVVLSSLPLFSKILSYNTPLGVAPASHLGKNANVESCQQISTFIS